MTTKDASLTPEQLEEWRWKTVASLEARDDLNVHQAITKGIAAALELGRQLGREEMAFEIYEDIVMQDGSDMGLGWIKSEEKKAQAEVRKLLGKE